MSQYENHRRGRPGLHHILEQIVGEDYVYFQPPTGTRLKYPCIVYNLESAFDTHANDHLYRRMRRYSLTYITKDPDDSVCDKLDNLQYCSFNRFFANDNLNHFVYSIYY